MTIDKEQRDPIRTAVSVWLILVGSAVILSQVFLASVPNDKLIGVGLALIGLSGLVKKSTGGNGS